MNAEFWAAIWGAIVGSVVGGGISFALQFWTFRHAAEERAAEKREREQALAFSLMVRVNRIADHCHAFAKWIDEAYTQGGEAEPWQFLKPMLNPPPLIHFPAEELAVLFPRDAELFNDMVVLDVTHNSTIAVVEEYNAQRRELYSLLRPVAMEGAVGALVLESEDFPVLQPRMFEVNEIADSLRATVAEDATKALVASHRLIGFGRDKLQMKIRVKPPPE